MSVVTLDLDDEDTLRRLVELQRASCVSFKRDAGTVDIHRLAVHPGAFRGGIATALLDALEAREAGAERWTVGTGAANVPARTLYERRGFAVTEERVVPGGIRWVRMDRPVDSPPS